MRGRITVDEDRDLRTSITHAFDNRQVHTCAVIKRTPSIIAKTNNRWGRHSTKINVHDLLVGRCYGTKVASCIKCNSDKFIVTARQRAVITRRAYCPSAACICCCRRQKRARRQVIQIHDAIGACIRTSDIWLPLAGRIKRCNRCARDRADRWLRCRNNPCKLNRIHDGCDICAISHRKRQINRPIGNPGNIRRGHLDAPVLTVLFWEQFRCN